jgi:hypothetical protein
MPDSAQTSLLRAPRFRGLLRGRFRTVQPLGPGNPAHIRVYSHVTATHQGEIRNAERFNRDELCRIQQERVGQVYTGQVMTGDWDSDECVRYMIKCGIYILNQSIRSQELEEFRSMLPRTGNDFIDGHHVPRIFTDVPGVFLIGARPDIRQQPSLPLIVAISAQGRRCTHVSGPEYSTVHIDCLPSGITGIAAGDELFYNDQHGFSTGVVQGAWLLGAGLHVILCVEGRSLDMMHLLHRLYWFVVLPAHRYCRASDRRHRHLRVLIQQDIDLRHSPCFEDLTEAITLHVI